MVKIQKILVGGLILMVVLNLCTLGFILFRPHHGGHGARGYGWGGHHNPFKELNLNSAQEEKMLELKTQLDNKMDSLRQKADKLREERFTLLKNETVNLAEANAKAIEIGNCFTQMEKLTFDHFLAIKKLLTKEQQAGFEKFVEQMGSRRQGRHHMRDGRGNFDRGQDGDRGDGRGFGDDDLGRGDSNDRNHHGHRDHGHHRHHGNRDNSGQTSQETPAP